MAAEMSEVNLIRSPEAREEFRSSPVVSHSKLGIRRNFLTDEIRLISSATAPMAEIFARNAPLRHSAIPFFCHLS